MITKDLAEEIIKRRDDPKEGPFKNEDDFLSYISSRGVNLSQFKENHLPMIFDTEYNFRITSTGTSGRTSSEIVAIVYDFDKVKERQEIFKFRFLYPDTASPATNQLIKNSRCTNVIDDFDKKGQIENGVALIRSKINPMAGTTKFFGLKGSVDFLTTEMQKYHNETTADGKILDMPVDEFNHSIDAVRYCAINRWPKGNKIIIADSSKIEAEQALSREEERKRVQENQMNWLSQEISKSAQTNGGEATDVKKSKSGSFFWSIDE